MTKLKTILVDFNNGQVAGDLMELNTRGSIRTLEETGAKAGETVLLYDGDDCSVVATLEMHARFQWDDIVTAGEGSFTPMKEVFCDFTVGPSGAGLMALNKRGSIQSIQNTGAVVGEKVVLTDGETWVVALLVKQDGIMYGRFDWDSTEDVKGPNKGD